MCILTPDYLSNDKFFAIERNVLNPFSKYQKKKNYFKSLRCDGKGRKYDKLWHMFNENFRNFLFTQIHTFIPYFTNATSKSLRSCEYS